MRKIFFFDVPIYKIEKESYEANQKLYIDECLNDDPEHHAEIEAFYRECPHAKIRNSDYFWRQYGGPWQFNEIIGYIRLYSEGYQIRGQLWYVDVKRVVRNPRHKILICKNAGLGFGIPVDTPTQSTNVEIFDLIMKYLDSVRLLPRFKKRFVDSSLFETIGPYVDWKSLINGA